jgi:drug/metabolite transporter (DMT)-like permease
MPSSATRQTTASPSPHRKGWGWPGGQARLASLALVVGGAVLWGLAGTAAEALFQRGAVEPRELVALRMLVGGAALLGATAGRSGWPRVWAPVRRPHELAAVFVFGVAGLLAAQYSYFAAIALSNVVIATLLQYLAPALVVMWTALARRRWPSQRLLAALVLASAGTYLLVAAGRGVALTLSPAAVAFGLTSAVALAFYTVYPSGLLKRYGPIVVVGWGLWFGGLVMAPWAAPWAIRPGMTIADLGLVAFVVGPGTVAAFTLYFQGVARLSPTVTSLAASAEPLAAAASGMVWLGVRLDGWQWIGGAVVAAGIALLAARAAPRNR